MAVKEKEETAEIKKEEAVELIEPAVTAKEVVVGVGENKLIFIQKPLTFFGKIEFFSIAGKAVESILKDGGSVYDMLGSVEDGSALDVTGGGETDAFIRGIALIVQHVPEILPELYCVILNVSRGEREYVKLRLEEDLQDAQGFEILETFVEQNWDILTNFFTQGILPLVQRVQKRM